MVTHDLKMCTDAGICRGLISVEKLRQCIASTNNKLLDKFFSYIQCVVGIVFFVLHSIGLQSIHKNVTDLTDVNVHCAYNQTCL